MIYIFYIYFIKKVLIKQFFIINFYKTLNFLVINTLNNRKFYIYFYKILLNFYKNIKKFSKKNNWFLDKVKFYQFKNIKYLFFKTNVFTNINGIVETKIFNLMNWLLIKKNMYKKKI